LEALEVAVSTKDMVHELTKQGYQVTTVNPVDDIVDIYNTVVTKNKRGISSQSIIETFTVQMYSPTHLHMLLTIAHIDWLQGGNFVGGHWMI
jgi:predicted CoA-binding protein